MPFSIRPYRRFPFDFNSLDQLIHYTMPREGNGVVSIGEGREDKERDMGVLSLKLGDGFDAVNSVR